MVACTFVGPDLYRNHYGFEPSRCEWDLAHLRGQLVHLTAIVFAIGLVLSCVFIVVLLLSVPTYWKTEEAQYTTERLEKARDAITSFVAFLIRPH